MTIVLIQRHFRLSRLNKCLKDLDLDNQISEDQDFDQFTHFIQKKDILQKVKQILQLISLIVKYDNTCKFNSRVFLTAFLIKDFKNQVLFNDLNHENNQTNSNEDSNQSLDQIIYELSVNLVNNYLSINKNISFPRLKLFYELLESYMKIFNNWKEHDLEKILQSLTISYYDLENIIIQIERTENISDNDVEYIQILKNNQLDLRDKISQLNGIDYFNQFRLVNLNPNPDMINRIKQSLHQAFWDTLIQELDSDPPIYTQLLKILSEIQDLFCKFVPNRPDIQQEIKERIDIELLSNMINNNAFEDEDLYNLTEYIISLVKRFQPPDMDDKVNEWEKEMQKQFHQEFKYSEFLVIFFQSVYNMIHTIIDYINRLDQVIDSNSN